MNSQQLKKMKIPDKPGVYFFLRGKDILYIGKATSLRDRVKSYFGKDLIRTRGPMILDMTTLATSIKWQEADSVLEALILEAYLIKKHQPKYNTREKDDKSFNYVCITNEEIPKVLIVRGREVELKKYDKVYGPFPNGGQLKEAMKIIRRLFPYYDKQSSAKNNVEFYRQLGLVPDLEITSQKYQNFYRFTPEGPYTAKNFDISSALYDYKKNIKNLILFFEGKKKKIIANLKKEMMASAKRREFEKAGEIKKKIFALEHINDIALIKEENISPLYLSGSNRLSLPLALRLRSGLGARAHTYDFHQTNTLYQFRVEAYDISHMSGQNMVGVMTVIENGEINKSEYKKFIIKTRNKSDDTGALEEVLLRRMNHSEWKYPNLIVVDGGVAQMNVVKKVLQNFRKISPNILFARSSDEGDGNGARPSQKEHSASFNIDIVSVLKNDKHKAEAILGDEGIINKYKKEILLANNEAHRFAITFHKNKRNKNFIA